MSVTFEMGFMIFEGAALLALIVIGLLLLRRPAAQTGSAAAPAKTPSERLEQRGEAGWAGPSAELEKRADEDDRPSPQTPDAALPGASEALVGRIGERVDESLRAFRDELENWARQSAADAANRRIDQALPGLERKILEEMRAVRAAASRPPVDMQRPPAAASPQEPRALSPAAAAVRAAAAAAESPGLAKPVVAAPSEARCDPAAPTVPVGVVLSRRPAGDAFAEACAWLPALGLDDDEEERLRADCADTEPSEVVRKLFTGLHKITSERRLAGDRPKLSWGRVGEETLSAFVRRFHSEGAMLIWPRVGESFDPRTMLPVFKEESGGGSVTEVVAPGYSGDTAQDAVKALVIY